MPDVHSATADGDTLDERVRRLPVAAGTGFPGKEFGKSPLDAAEIDALLRPARSRDARNDL